METLHINERGSHTTAIEGARDILRLFQKKKIQVSPGFIEAGVGAKGKSIKLKKLNNETFEMVIVVNSSKQVFKVYGNQEEIEKCTQKLRSDGWNIQKMIDLSLI